MSSISKCVAQAQTPTRINHIVLRVRDIHESHVFWTQCLGFEHVGTKGATRFYSGRRGGLLNHHDIALVENADMTDGDETVCGIDHVAIEYASEAAWIRQNAFLESRKLSVRRIRRGTIISSHLEDPNGYTIELVCDLPRELWENDINAALNKPSEPFN